MSSAAEPRINAKPSGTPVLVVDGDKGGVGKSFVARTIAHMLAVRNRPCLAVDVDPRNGTLERFDHAQRGERKNWLEPAAWDDTYRQILQADPSTTILFDLPAQVGDVWMKQAPRLIATAKHLRRKVLRVWVMNRAYDSVNLLDDTLSAVAIDDTFAVLNRKFGEVSTFTTWTNSKLRPHFLSNGGRELTFPPLPDGVANEIDDRDLSFAAASTELDLPFYLVDLEAFLAEAEREFAPLMERLS